MIPLVTLLVALSSAGADTVDRGGTRRALLIGIDNYQAPKVTKLRGAVHDTYLVENLLRTRFAFDEVATLRDAEATRSAILQGIDRLVEVTKPQDVVWIHFSGHGSQVADTNGDEPDGKDETWIPFDGRAKSVPDITDDELGARLSKLKSPHVIVVADSCHSGTGTRNPWVVSRTAEEDSRTALYSSAAKATEMDLPHVFFSGAAAHQEALDATIDGAAFGLFTRALVQTLGTADDSWTVRQVLGDAGQRYRRSVAWLGATPSTPGLEGPRAKLDQPLLPSGEGSRVAWVSAKVQAGGWVLENGSRLGAAPGTLWALYPVDDDRLEAGRELAVLRVLQKRGGHAWGHTDRKIGPKAARAVLLAYAPFDALSVHVRRGDALRQTIRRELPFLRVVEDGEFAQVTVTQVRSSYRIEAAGETGVTPREVPEAQALQMLTQSAVAQALLGIDRPSSEVHLEVRAEGQEGLASESVSARNITIVANDTQPKHLRFHRGRGDPFTSENCLQLHLRTDRDAYVTVAAVGPDGSLQQLFPLDQFAHFIPDGLVRAAEPVSIPDRIGSNEAGFNYAYSPPAGRNVVRVFAMENLADAKLLRSTLRALGAAEMDPSQRVDRLEGLRRSLSGVTSRSFYAAEVPEQAPKSTTEPDPVPTAPVAPTTAATGDWCAVSLNLLVGGES